ncbi:MAG: DNA alkylation repair protein [Alphaproteobacteria bacterium]
MQRKGANSPQKVPADILCALNKGTLETASLSEALAVDFGQLLQFIAPSIPTSALPSLQAGTGVVQRMKNAAHIALAHGIKWQEWANHPADTVRGWAAYMLAALPNIEWGERLHMIQPLAADQHFGVREWAWLALRPHFIAALPEALTILVPWTHHEDANIRRFASEISRPRGVWCTHIPLLKQKPWLALPLLEPLYTDSSRYVQNSVANWLNDAGKHQPEWVENLCTGWQEKSNHSATQYICRRALRHQLK